MSETFLIADTHFGHTNMTRFKREDGTPVRPFSTVEEIDNTLIKNWNNIVRDNDKVYVLGDVVINRKALSVLYSLKGKKVLIKGNHDIFKLKDYVEHFYDIRSCKVTKHFIMTHIPIHPGSLRGHINIHGHTHHNIIDDPRYFCVSVEQINYTPINFNTIIVKFNAKV